ncbi:hypothetical protein KR49_12990 [Synechococcus sp. KORDI-49]|nr:hypothetical protein KR49_12990 [Synechococcus sp. KORDI-49]
MPCLITPGQEAMHFTINTMAIGIDTEAHLL